MYTVVSGARAGSILTSAAAAAGAARLSSRADVRFGIFYNSNNSSVSDTPCAAPYSIKQGASVAAARVAIKI